jgi:predicted RNA-binding Zn-ribbon protein involved in translation (DUF1610 family)
LYFEIDPFPTPRARRTRLHHTDLCMSTVEESRQIRESLEQQERYYNDQIKKLNAETSRLRGTRRRRIVQRILALFGGIVLCLFGFIDLIVIQSLEAHFNNIIIFTVSELGAIPLIRYGLVLFRTMPIDTEINAVSTKIVEIQDLLEQLRQERLKVMREPVKVVRPATETKLEPPKVSTDDFILPDQPAPVCPECGKEVHENAKICRNCGHLFI